MTTGPVLPYTITMFFCLYGALPIQPPYECQSQSSVYYHISRSKRQPCRRTHFRCNWNCNSSALSCSYQLLVRLPALYWRLLLTLALAIISFKEPWNLLVASFKELANGTIHFPEIHDSIYQLLEPYLKEDSNDVEIHIFKQGMKIRVKINLHNVHHEIIQKLLEDKPQMLYLLEKTS